MTNKINIIVVVSSIIVIVGGVFFLAQTGTFNNTAEGGGPADSLASCIAESGAAFYGAYWCPACNAQKELFGASAPLLPYEECSVPGQKTQTIECRQKEISAYPTWRFADGYSTSTLLSFEKLAEYTGCKAPQI